MDKLISIRAAIDALERKLAEPYHTGEDWYVGINCAEAEIYGLPSAQPEVPDINVGDIISRQATIDLLRKRLIETANNNVGFTCDAGQVFEDASERIRDWIDELPSAQPEPTFEQIEEYCHKRCLSIVDNALLHKYAQPATNCSEIPNVSDVVSRKAVREMVATWSYDLAEWEDMELALHDVDELPHAQPEVIHCKDCKHYRTIGAFGVPLHKEEYFCDADNYTKNDSGEEQRELPEWWFCAGAERKDNE